MFAFVSAGVCVACLLLSPLALHPKPLAVSTCARIRQQRMRVHDDDGDLNEMGGGDEDEEDDERAMADAVGHMFQAARRSLGIQGAAPHSAINGNHGQLTAQHISYV